MRTITVYSTRGNKYDSFESDATTWGQITSQVEEIVGTDISKLAATESIRKTDLNHVDSQLPEEPFTVFLRPVKTDSGAMSFAECREFISANPEIKAHLNTFAKQTGRNWTQLKTEELNELINPNEPVAPAPTVEYPTDEHEEDILDTLESAFSDLYGGFIRK